MASIATTTPAFALHSGARSRRANDGDQGGAMGTMTDQLVDGQGDPHEPEVTRGR